MNSLFLWLCILISFACESSSAFILPDRSSCQNPIQGTVRSKRTSSLFRNNPNDDNDEDKENQDLNLAESVDNFLDQTFFDPDAYEDDDTSFGGRLANFVKSDYELAETLYVGTIFVIMVIISQELLRMQLYGEQYIPFRSLPSSGRLF